MNSDLDENFYSNELVALGLKHHADDIKLWTFQYYILKINEFDTLLQCQQIIN